MHQGVDLPTGACGPQWSLPRGVIATDLPMPRSRGGAGTEAGVGVETVAGEGSHTHTHTHTPPVESYMSCVPSVCTYTNRCLSVSSEPHFLPVIFLSLLFNFGGC
jgi:hypothetical protein